MIKTIDTSVVTPQMCKPLGFYNEHSIGWVRAILEAAPDVKSEPIGTLILGGIIARGRDRHGSSAQQSVGEHGR